MLKEIRLFSRGGQGGVTGAKLLAYAASLQGFEVQAIPKYGAERKGAPIFVDVRVSDKQIKTHSPVGGQADHYLILDPSLLDKLPEINGKALFIVNSSETPHFELKNDLQSLGIVDAYQIAKDEQLIKSGTPIVSTTMLGAYCKATNDFISIKSLEEAVLKTFNKNLAIKNINAIKKAYENFLPIPYPELVST